MALPKKKKSKSKTRIKRKLNYAFTANKLAKCSNKDCEEMILPHTVCPHCGHYKNRKIIETEKEK